MALKSDNLWQPGRGRGAWPAPDGRSDHFRRVTEDASPALVGRLLAEAFRSGHPLPFAELLSQVFGSASPPRQQDILVLLLERLSEAALKAMPCSEAVDNLVALSRGGALAISSQPLDQISPDLVQLLARLAEWHDPAVIERISILCAEDTDLLAALDDETLAVVVALLDHEEERGP